MDSSSIEDKATSFALEILRKHPRISYSHAVAAAGYAGVGDFPQHLFYQVVRRLGIDRDDTETEVAVIEQLALPRSLDVARSRPTNSHPGNSSALSSSAEDPVTEQGEQLIEKLEALRGDFEETAEMRAALIDIRRVVRAALEEL